jgi:NAD(P)-dependent dehydrogenase (short-subunit alcohol dehydrogenase family)
MGGQIAFPGLSLYHATKWGIEGFFEAVRQEAAPFGVEVTLVQPGGARTDFAGRSMGVAEPIDAYDAVLAPLRSAVGTGGDYAVGDPAKMVAAIIESADRSPAPRRLALGSDAFQLMSSALTERLAELNSGRELALSTDF